ncbi:MAG: hypothetical protein JWR16_3175 [Nevskia sp.]|nr:hypothetical protein [Nevskia sp.]
MLSRADYRLDRMAWLIPTDLALGWGRMSDSAVLQTLEIEQSGRYYFWHTAGFAIPREEIETHSANMHMIPANAAAARALGRVRTGNLVTLSGALVEVRSKAGWSIRSSLTRDDTGPGACEVVWLQALDLR